MYIIYVTKHKNNSSANTNTSTSTSTTPAPSVSQTYTPSTTTPETGFWSTYGTEAVSTIVAPITAPFVWGSKLFFQD